MDRSPHRGRQPCSSSSSWAGADRTGSSAVGSGLHALTLRKVWLWPILIVWAPSGAASLVGEAASIGREEGRRRRRRLPLGRRLARALVPGVRPELRRRACQHGGSRSPGRRREPGLGNGQAGCDGGRAAAVGKRASSPAAATVSRSYVVQVPMFRPPMRGQGQGQTGSERRNVAGSGARERVREADREARGDAIGRWRRRQVAALQRRRPTPQTRTEGRDA